MTFKHASVRRRPQQSGERCLHQVTDWSPSSRFEEGLLLEVAAFRLFGLVGCDDTQLKGEQVGDSDFEAGVPRPPACGEWLVCRYCPLTTASGFKLDCGGYKVAHVGVESVLGLRDER